MASVVHYGLDSCHRIALLCSAGFDVAGCDSVPTFQRLLETASYDAILIADPPIEPLIRTARRLTAAPLIWFPTDPATVSDPRFDLVIPPLTNPREWIDDMRRLLATSRRIVARSALLGAQSEALRAESAALRKVTRLRIEQIRDTRRRG